MASVAVSAVPVPRTDNFPIKNYQTTKPEVPRLSALSFISLVGVLKSVIERYPVIGIWYEGNLNEQGQFADTRTETQKRSMAALIRELKTRFPKARILGHRDLPGVRKACPCYDVAKDQNGEEPSQSLKNLPQIRGRPMHRGQKRASDSGDNYARGAET